MKVIETKIPDVLIIEPKVFSDHRGFFMETYQLQKYSCLGVEGRFVQDNLSYSKYGTLRGLHFQNPHGQGKLVSVLAGSVFDVAVDIRIGSPWFGQWVGCTISAENRRQIWIPPGFAHGFCVTSKTATFTYKCTDYYAPESEHTIMWNDPTLAIGWPIDNPVVSEKDLRGLAFEDIQVSHLSDYEGERHEVFATN